MGDLIHLADYRHCDHEAVVMDEQFNIECESCHRQWFVIDFLLEALGVERVE